MKSMSAPTPSLPRRILVVRLGAIGDVANALVFATAVKDVRPDVRVGWVVHPLAAPLVEGHPSVDRVHLWKRGGGLGEFRRVVRELRDERYELAVDLQRIQKSSLLARLSGAPRVLGYDRARAKEGSWIWMRERIPPRELARPMVLHYLEFAAYLGIAVEEPRRLLPHVPDAQRWADALVRELGGAPVLINVGASKPLNRWLPERFGELARALMEPSPGRLGGLVVCFTGGPDADDRAAGGRALAAAGTRARDLVGKTTLAQWIALARRARLFVGCDTGPMHLAAAVETPVVALFGPADPARTGPYGSGHRIVPAPHGRMEELGVAPVLEAVRASLAVAAR
jgi:ADP-heptose:LPS heptosyltransferase